MIFKALICFFSTCQHYELLQKTLPKVNCSEKDGLVWFIRESYLKVKKSCEKVLLEF
uniref:Uncharacterized protein n=1 Tax=Arundo donax TaxID=35708 RepID=A0A0A9AHY7_ARUDO